MTTEEVFAIPGLSAKRERDNKKVLQPLTTFTTSHKNHPFDPD
jgi:hypothetical protein